MNERKRRIGRWMEGQMGQMDAEDEFLEATGAAAAGQTMMSMPEDPIGATGDVTGMTP